MPTAETTPHPLAPSPTAHHQSTNHLPPACPGRIGKVFTFLGLSVGVITAETETKGKIAALKRDVTYITGGWVRGGRAGGWVDGWVLAACLGGWAGLVWWLATCLPACPWPWQSGTAGGPG